MAKSNIKIRAKLKKGSCEVKALMKHPMETGQRKNKKTGKKIPAHFIQEVTCSHNDSVILSADWGGAISTNPYLSFIFEGAKKGDKVTISWTDNQGATESQSAPIK